MSVTAEHYLPLWEGWGGLPRGWLLMEQGEGLAGISHVQKSWSLIEDAATGAQFSRSYYLALLAEGLQYLGQVGDGLTALSEAFIYVEQTLDSIPAATAWYLAGHLKKQEMWSAWAVALARSGRERVIPTKEGADKMYGQRLTPWG